MHSLLLNPSYFQHYFRSVKAGLPDHQKCKQKLNGQLYVFFAHAQ